MLIVEPSEVVRAGIEAAVIPRVRGPVRVVAPEHVASPDAVRVASGRPVVVNACASDEVGDHLAGVSAIRTLLAGRPVEPSHVIAYAWAPARPHLRLRLAEAGADFLIEHTVLFESASGFVALVSDPPERSRLPTQWAIRERLGLAWDGDVNAFLEAISDVPLSVWTGAAKQSALPISRRQIRRLRELARDVAGLPAPEFERFSTSYRAAPTAPEWARVRAFVRTCLGLDWDDHAR